MNQNLIGCRERKIKRQVSKVVQRLVWKSICGSEKMAAKLQIHGRLLMIIIFVIVLNIEKKKQWKSL